MKLLSSINVISLLTFITAAVHLYLGVTGGLGFSSDGTLHLLFVLNGMGYLFLLVAVFWTPNFLEAQNPALRRFFMAYVVVTITLYFVVNVPQEGWLPTLTFPLGMFTKGVEVLLLIGIWLSKKNPA